MRSGGAGEWGRVDWRRLLLLYSAHAGNKPDIEELFADDVRMEADADPQRLL